MPTNAMPHENSTIIKTLYTVTTNASPCTANDEYKYMVYSCVYSLVFVVGLVSNLLALFVFYRIAKRKNASTVYLMNLAIADLLFVLSLPLRIVYYRREGDWPFRDFLCKISTYIFYVSMYCSIFFLTCLSISRYLSVAHHARHQRLFTFRRCIIACVSVWIFVCSSTAPFLLTGTQAFNGKIKCFEPMNVDSWGRIARMNYFALTIGFLIPFAIVLICYSLLIKRLMGVSWGTKRAKRDVATTVLVLGVFLICFLPYHVQRTVHLHFLMQPLTHCDLENTLRKSVVATLCLAVANSCFDPLLYIFVGQGFRKFVKTWLKKKEAESMYSSSSSKLVVSIAFVQQGRELEMSSIPTIRTSQTLLDGGAKEEHRESDESENLFNAEQSSPQ
uniref:cysteinyl leukotriene receptor 1-like n=1 Tax=Pristiophorus japonicus TaxID=55135 RepID=UPI00398E507D